MSSVSKLVEGAFARLASKPGYVERADQLQLSLLIADLMGQDGRGAFEAPTGLGKSLAALIPAISHAIISKKRTVVATYTNVLAEQYWRKDLPLAMSLFEFEGEPPKTEFLIGRQRYVCLAALDEHAPDLLDNFQHVAELGIETEFRERIARSSRDLTQLWSKVSTPPVCPGRLCPAYEDCFYYNARKRAEKAQIVITNHSVVLTDAILARASVEDQGNLGKYDFLILDEAHDFAQAATNSLEFELSESKLSGLVGVAARMEKVLLPLADLMGDASELNGHCRGFRERIDRAQVDLKGYGLTLGRTGILCAAPAEISDHPQVKSNGLPEGIPGAQRLAEQISDSCEAFVKGIDLRIERWRGVNPEATKPVADSIVNYGSFLRLYGIGCFSLFEPQGVAVSYAGRNGQDPMLRQDVIGLSEPLRELVWNRVPYVCLSATLALDGAFDFFRRTVGAQPEFEEILPSPFDYRSQASLYVPKVGVIPDPSVARKEGFEAGYWAALAKELTQIITAVRGRTLALFHSRKEMEAVYERMVPNPDLPLFIQSKFGVGTVGEKFRSNTSSSLFALRSFWTGFDAPGETLSCVVLVRVPFEVPIDPPQIARTAYLQTLGLDPFMHHSLPNAKMMMRQGAGRLIRQAEDRGVIALLDPRLRTKRYGEDIIGNLPSEMRMFDDVYDAVAWVGLD